MYKEFACLNDAVFDLILALLYLCLPNTCKDTYLGYVDIQSTSNPTQ